MSEFDGNYWTNPVTITMGENYFINWADFPSIYYLNDNRFAAH